MTLNRDAGCGGHVIITLRLDSREELPFLVDTGSPMTILDKSLEPQLGPPLGAETLWNFRTRHEAGAYAAPKLYLGSARLVTDSNVLTSDYIAKLSSGADRPVMGTLGMDCLRHYCIQLDFQAGTMRFLHPAQVRPAKLGKAFPLTFSSKGSSYVEWIRPYVRHAGLLGGEDTELLIDTGYDIDGAIEPGLFRRGIRDQSSRLTRESAQDPEPNNIRLSRCVWNGVTYTDVLVGNGADSTDGQSGENALGLRFLARHLVTFDFPGRTMYLKRISRGPFVSHEVRALARAAGDSAFRLAGKLMRKGQLPGWSARDRGRINRTYHYYPARDVVMLNAQKKDDPSTYHYEFARASKTGPWHLRKAWRTDQTHRKIEAYPVP